MHVTSSALAQTATHESYSFARRTETLRIQTRREPGRKAEAPKPAEASGSTFTDAKDELKFRLLVKLFEALTGKRIRIVTNLGKNGARSEGNTPPAPDTRSTISRTDINYTVSETIHESEKTAYSARGIVRTADGAELEISVDLSMSREFYSETSISLINGQEVKDPLVVNYAGTLASLAGEKFAFDLDSDGSMEQIATLRPGSGYLALDKNGDGEINDGKELFGPVSGDGFRELKGYDSDGNGWIDEADPVYAKLKVWIMDGSGGRGRLMALASLGIGAISLQSLATPFELKDLATNQTYGQIASTSVFLREDGGAGTVQRIDLAV